MSEERTHFSRFISGLTFGLGFSIALVAVSLSAGYLIYLGADRPAQYRLKTYGPEAELTIVSHEAKRSEHDLRVLGQVRNDGNDTWNFVRLHVDLFDGDSFVGNCWGRTGGPMHPQNQRYFEIKCGGDKWDPVPEHTRYTIEIVDVTYQLDADK